MSTTFEAEGKNWEIAFSMSRIEMYESHYPPIMATFAKNSGLFSVRELKSIIAYGLRPEGGVWINPKQGMQMAEKLIENSGYAAALENVHEALERDCGFFFTMGSTE